MVISSRTPEGTPNKCPLCGAEIRIEPSTSSGDAPCPNCGTLLWFITDPSGVRYYDREMVQPVWEAVRELIREAIGLAKEQIKPSTSFDDLQVDSLDTVELIMAVEEKFDITFSEEDLPKLKTVGDLVDLIIQGGR